MVHPRVRETAGPARRAVYGDAQCLRIYEFGLYVFMLAAFLGLEVIRSVSPLLHTPLMSLTNAISAISVVGAILITGDEDATHAEQGARLHRRSPRPPPTS